MRRLFVLLSLFSFLGCNAQPTTSSNADATSASADEHASEDSHAGHDHGEVGPHGGHMLHLEPSGEHAEWTHDESDQVSVYLDFPNADETKQVKFVVDIPSAESEAFEMTKEGDAWVVSSAALMTHLNMGEAVTVNLVVVSADGEQTAEVENEDHDHHHH